MEETAAQEAADGNWTYAAVRPQDVQIPVLLPAKPEVDCSDGVRALCFAAKVPDDPAGLAYADYGNSSSIWLHLRKDDPPLTEVEVGDIFTFGYWTGEDHACMAYDVTDSANPQVWNMGEQGQPVIHALSIEVEAHAGMTVTLCKLNLPPDPPPTPQQQLQAKTGFYAWVAWRLSEGPWKGYPPRYAAVRPDVPKVISPAWWLRLSQFLLARKKPNAS